MDAQKLLRSKLSHSVVLGIIALSAVLAIAISTSLFDRFRVDLTEAKLYTLAEGTQTVLKNLNVPVSLTFYYSRESTKTVAGFREYGMRIDQLLSEMVTVADGKLGLEEVDPRPFSEQEDEADLAGLRGVQVGARGEKAFMGLVVKAQGGDSEVIPFLHPDRDGFLEYDIVKAIHKVSREKSPVIGVMSELPLFGGGGFQFFQAPTPPWAVINQLEQMFMVENIPVTSTFIPENIDALVIVQPTKMSEETAYAVEQYLFKGGKAMIFVDPLVEGVGPVPDKTEASAESAIYDLFDAWGVAFSKGHFVGDFDHALAITMHPNSQPVRHPALLGIPAVGIDSEDSVTAELKGLNFAFAGAFSLVEDAAKENTPDTNSAPPAAESEAKNAEPLAARPKSEVTLTPLVRTSERSDLVDVSQTEDDPSEDPRGLMLSMKPKGKRMALVARLRGKAVSAFDSAPGAMAASYPAQTADPETKPADSAVTQDGSTAQADNGDEPSHLQSGDINVLLFGDVDMLTDRLWVSVQDFMGTQVYREFANNGALFINSVDTLVGSDALIDIRSRGEFGRPFEVIEDLKRGAEEKFRSEEEKLIQKLEATERSLAQLSAEKKGEDGLVIKLTPEQEKALTSFQEEKVVIRKSLRDVRLKLNEDIEDLDFTLKVINIVGMPVLVTVLFILFNLRQRTRFRRQGGR